MVIIACDFATKQELANFIEKFDEPLFLKIGMELFYKEGIELIKEVKGLGHQIFLDLKLHDIPNTVYKALCNLKALEIDFITVHALGGAAMLEAATKAMENTNTKVLAVTVLTSFDEQALQQIGIMQPVGLEVAQLINVAKAANIDGIVCSPYEAKAVRDAKLFSVTPGIRLANNNQDDQKRVATPMQAKQLGSDYIVVGRSITNASDVVGAYKQCVNEFGG